MNIEAPIITLGNSHGDFHRLLLLYIDTRHMYCFIKEFYVIPRISLDYKTICNVSIDVYLCIFYYIPIHTT